jgi:hypothetical protein
MDNPSNEAVNPLYGQLPPPHKPLFDKTKWVLLGYKYLVYGFNTAIVMTLLGCAGVFIYGLVMCIKS